MMALHKKMNEPKKKEEDHNKLPEDEDLINDTVIEFGQQEAKEAMGL